MAICPYCRTLTGPGHTCPTMAQQSRQTAAANAAAFALDLDPQARHQSIEDELENHARQQARHQEQ